MSFRARAKKRRGTAAEREGGPTGGSARRERSASAAPPLPHASRAAGAAHAGRGAGAFRSNILWGSAPPPFRGRAACPVGFAASARSRGAAERSGSALGGPRGRVGGAPLFSFLRESVGWARRRGVRRPSMRRAGGHASERSP